VLIKGDFMVVKTSGRWVGPERGYMCFSLEKATVDPETGQITGRVPLEGKRKEMCLIEWDDLKSIVKEKGKGKGFVAFGSAYSEPYQGFADVEQQTVKKTAAEAVENKRPYPLNHGLNVLRTTRVEEVKKNPVAVLQEYEKKNP